MSLASRCQNNDLVELHATRLCESEHSHVGEVFAQQSGALCQSQLRNDEQKNASGSEPAIGMFKENKFQSLVIAFPGFPIVGRIEVEQRSGLCLAPDIHGVRLQSLDSHISRMFRTI